MKEIVVYEMRYDDLETAEPDITCVPFEDSYFDEYMTIYNDCFYNMRKALDIKPYNWYSEYWQIEEKADSIYLLLKNEKIIGAVACYDNEIDDLIVGRAFQNKGYGKRLLQWAMHMIRSQSDEPIILHVAEWNKKAISIYQQAGFVITKKERVR